MVTMSGSWALKGSKRTMLIVGLPKHDKKKRLKSPWRAAGNWKEKKENFHVWLPDIEKKKIKQLPCWATWNRKEKITMLGCLSGKKGDCDCSSCLLRPSLLRPEGHWRDQQKLKLCQNHCFGWGNVCWFIFNWVELIVFYDICRDR